jgi:hypothetical protein
MLEQPTQPLATLDLRRRRALWRRRHQMIHVLLADTNLVGLDWRQMRLIPRPPDFNPQPRLLLALRRQGVVARLLRSISQLF